MIDPKKLADLQAWRLGHDWNECSNPDHEDLRLLLLDAAARAGVREPSFVAALNELADEMDESDVMTGPGIGEWADRVRDIAGPARTVKPGAGVRDPEEPPANLDYESEWYRKGWEAGAASVAPDPSTALDMERLREAAQEALDVMDSYASPLSGDARQRRPAMNRAARRLRAALAHPDPKP